MKHYKELKQYKELRVIACALSTEKMRKPKNIIHLVDTLRKLKYYFDYVYVLNPMGEMEDKYKQRDIERLYFFCDRLLKKVEDEYFFLF